MCYNLCKPFSFLLIYYTGQNKNRFVLAYLARGKLVFPVQNLLLHFQIAGHTSCLVDAGFGQGSESLESW